MLLIRLAPQETDIVVTVNMPYMRGAYEAEDVDFAQGKLGSLGQAGEALMERVRATFEVRDWELFGVGRGGGEG